MGDGSPTAPETLQELGQGFQSACAAKEMLEELAGRPSKAHLHQKPYLSIYLSILYSPMKCHTVSDKNPEAEALSEPLGPEP